MRTSWPAFSREASVNVAWYLLVRREPELAEHHDQHRRDQQHRHGEDADVEQGPITLHQYSSLSA